MSLKRSLSIVFLLIILIALASIFFNGNAHLEVSKEAEKLVENNQSLTKKINVVITENKKIQAKVEAKDSALAVKESQIVSLNFGIYKVRKDVNLKQVIYIHDTIYITEKKNFWGKSKKTITSVSNVDTTQTFTDTTNL
jgi:hypothetical protein